MHPLYWYCTNLLRISCPGKESKSPSLSPVILSPLRYRTRHTVSSYLLLITHALSTIEYLSLQSWMYVISPLLRGCTHRRSSSPTSLVVFDTQLDHLKLPILRTPPRSAFDERDEAEDAPRPESVLFFAEKYFELSGTLCQSDFRIRTITWLILAFSTRTSRVGPTNICLCPGWYREKLD